MFLKFSKITRIAALSLVALIGSASTPVFQHNSSNGNIDRLYSLAKVYGYVRYFYPGDETSRVDWDRFAFLSVKHLAEGRRYGLKKNLEDLFLPVAPGISIQERGCKADDEQVVPANLKPIYWQHSGDGKGSVGYPYKSLRVNRPARVLPDSPNDFFTLRKLLDPEKLKGREVKLSVKIRLGAIYIGRPSILLNFKAKGKDQESISSEGQTISQDWATHEIIKILPDDVEKIAVVIQSVGMAGEVFFDALRLQVREGTEWRDFFVENFDAFDLNVLQTEWRPLGPNNEASISNHNDNGFVRISRTMGKPEIHNPLFNDSPLGDPIKLKQIGSGLTLRLPLVVYGTDSVTYPLGSAAALAGILQQLESVNQNELRAENLYARLANVIILWNVLQHFYPGFQSVKINWDQQLKVALKRSYADQSFDDHRITLSRMIEPLKDSHMTIYSAPHIQYYYPPIKWQHVEGKIVVTGVLDSNLPISVGDIISAVDDVKTPLRWKEIKQHVIGATESRKNFKAIDESLRGAKDSGILVEYATVTGEKRSLRLNRTLSAFEYNRLGSAASNLGGYSELKDGIFYVNPTTLNWNDLQTHIEELSTAKGIVLDLRGYPRWETIDIIAHFIQAPIYGMATRKPRIVFPDQEKMTFDLTPGDTIQPAKPYVGCPKVLLTNGQALSYAEDFVNRMSYYKLARIVGEPTGGATGTSNTTYLLGSLYNVWTGMTVVRQDGQLFNGVGVIPDDERKPTIIGTRDGKDELLEYAVGLLQLAQGVKERAK